MRACRLPLPGDGGKARGGLAHAPGRVAGAVDQLHVDLGHLGEAQDGVARPVHADDARAVPLEFFLERARDGLDDLALDLRALRRRG